MDGNKAFAVTQTKTLPLRSWLSLPIWGGEKCQNLTFVLDDTFPTQLYVESHSPAPITHLNPQCLGALAQSSLLLIRLSANIAPSGHWQRWDRDSGVPFCVATLPLD